MMNKPSYVDHTYRDFSRYLDDGGEVCRHKKVGNNFPAKLHQLLSESHFSHIIVWMPHGRAFKILNKDLLMSEAAPQYFAQTKFRSFTRQLCGWGFKRLYKPGQDFGCYYHEQFLRDLTLLTWLMHRVEPNIGKSTPFPGGEPDFYLISRSHPLPPAMTFGHDENANMSASQVVPAATLSAQQPEQNLATRGLRNSTQGTAGTQEAWMTSSSSASTFTQMNCLHPYPDTVTSMESIHPYSRHNDVPISARQETLTHHDQNHATLIHDNVQHGDSGYGCSSTPQGQLQTSSVPWQRQRQDEYCQEREEEEDDAFYQFIVDHLS